MNAEARRFVRFALVGGTGFLMDAGVLTLLIHAAGLGPFTARILSIAAAALTTWRLNRAVTFGASGSHQGMEAMRYGIVAAATAGLNYSIYALGLILVPGVPPLGAMIFATGTAMLFSYLGYSRFAFAGAARTSVGAPSSHSR